MTDNHHILTYSQSVFLLLIGESYIVSVLCTKVCCGLSVLIDYLVSSNNHLQRRKIGKGHIGVWASLGSDYSVECRGRVNALQSPLQTKIKQIFSAMLSLLFPKEMPISSLYLWVIYALSVMKRLQKRRCVLSSSWPVYIDVFSQVSAPARDYSVQRQGGVSISTLRVPHCLTHSILIFSFPS